MMRTTFALMALPWFFVIALQVTPPPRELPIPRNEVKPADVLAQEVENAAEAQMQRMAILISSIIGGFTTLAGFMYTIYRENRNRRWDLEDRERARRELTVQVEDTVVRTRKEANGQQRLLIDKIDENTAATKFAGRRADDAYKAANDVNQKIAALANVEHKLDALSAAYNSVSQRASQLEQHEKKP